MGLCSFKRINLSALEDYRQFKLPDKYIRKTNSCDFGQMTRSSSCSRKYKKPEKLNRAREKMDYSGEKSILFKAYFALLTQQFPDSLMYRRVIIECQAEFELAGIRLRPTPLH